MEEQTSRVVPVVVYKNGTRTIVGEAKVSVKLSDVSVDSVTLNEDYLKTLGETHPLPINAFSLKA